MITRKKILLCLTLAAGITLHGQNNETIEEYIATYKEIAITEMQRTGVPASIKLAQGIHETMAGQSPLVKKSNNHFGIKCKSNWTGPSVSHTDDAPNECFRKYDEPQQSYRDHSDFLRNNTRYASLFNLDPLDYEGWAKGLKKAGYATNPKYPQIIIKLVEDYHLQDYTLIAMGKTVPGQEEVAAVLPEDKKQETLQEPLAMETEQPAAASEYPMGEFRVNGTKVVYIGAGVALLPVAEQYKIPLSKLFEFNDLAETETLLKAQLIFLQRKRKTGDHEFHVVKTGETLLDIAQTEGIRLESLLELNLLRNYMQPATGEKLYLRSKAPVMPKLAETLTNTNRVTPASGR
ncbi:MAG: LysM peptidoglycan-binding domain-containing protein [Chitinophagaceae bacterium]|nr:MAG: LysM peptidoglycan-binding domain-containing protein [Chitinophagaceae bacterium]